jgi:4-alpha-glucanotransferase
VLESARRAGVSESGDSGDDVEWTMIRLLFSSRARLTMLQLQDVLGLGSEARMNMPGTAKGSWKWRLEAGQLEAEHARRLRAATEEAGRLASP